MRLSPPILLGSLLLAGCWTFEQVVVEGHSDSGHDQGTESDSGPTAPEIVACVGTASQPQLALTDRPTGAVLPPIGFVGTTAADGSPEGQLVWIESGRAHHRTVQLQPNPPAITLTGAVAGPFGAAGAVATVYDVAVGADADSDAFTWAIAGDGCAAGVDTYWWGGDDSGLIHTESEPCDGDPPRLFGMEVSGGFNPFTQRADVPRNIVWQSDASQVVALGGTFGTDESILAPWTGQAPNFAYTLATHGELVLLPNRQDELFAWNVTQPRGASVSPPSATSLVGARGRLAIAALSGPDYVVARVEGTEIVLEHFRGRSGTNDFQRVEEWYRLGTMSGLANPGALEIATFEGGFALWYEERGVALGENAWTVQAFEVVGEALRVYDCPHVYRYPSLAYLDNDLAAFRIGRDLFVAGAVHYELGGERRINIEGPYWTRLFAQE